MTELQRLLSACEEQLRHGRQCALATVVQVEGSAYRRPGARMLITDTGQLTGTISGGCLEGDARRRALQVMQRGKPEIVVYDSLDLDDDLEQGAQLGCQGLVHVLIEPLTDLQNKTVKLLKLAAKQNVAANLITILRAGMGEEIQVGASLLITATETWCDAKLNDNIQSRLIADARHSLDSKSPGVKNYEIAGSLYDVFFENIQPAPILAIFGAGNDALPLVKLAVNLGWRVHIVDGRANLATRERFPMAEQTLCIKIDEVNHSLRRNEFAVLMSHNYLYDKAVLKALLNDTAVKYIGMLGPKKKADRMLGELKAEGHDITPGFEEKLFGPVGINIGAEAAEEIALAVMAELIAVKNEHPAGFLRDLNGPIHKPDARVAYHAS